jgi:hypothetical protein
MAVEAFDSDWAWAVLLGAGIAGIVIYIAITKL